MPEIYSYGEKFTRNPNLNITFALNSLVAIDNAAWLVFAHENQLHNSDDIVPDIYMPAFSYRNEKVGSNLAFLVGTEIEKIRNAVDQGYFIMKLKTGVCTDLTVNTILFDWNKFVATRLGTISSMKIGL